MKGIILAVLAAIMLAGCVAVPYEPAPYYSAPAYYYPPPPAVGVYYSSRPYYHRHWRRW